VGAQCSKVRGSLLGYNFVAEHWSSYHIKLGGNSPQTWSLRLTEEESDGTVTRRIYWFSEPAAGDPACGFTPVRWFMLTGARITFHGEKIFSPRMSLRHYLFGRRVRSTPIALNQSSPDLDTSRSCVTCLSTLTTPPWLVLTYAEIAGEVATVAATNLVRQWLLSSPTASAPIQNWRPPLKHTINWWHGLLRWVITKPEHQFLPPISHHNSPISHFPQFCFHRRDRALTVVSVFQVCSCSLLSCFSILRFSWCSSTPPIGLGPLRSPGTRSIARGARCHRG
jgi:hypothetical protein